MKKKIKMRIVNTLLIVDIGIVIFCYLAGERDWFLNSQVAYLSSLIIVLASMYSYAQMVKTSVANEMATISNDELLEKIEDPHGLYDNSHYKQVQDDEYKEKPINTVEAIKKNKAYVSLYRIGAYVILVLGFLYLQNMKIFHMPSYMFGLFIPPVLIAIVFYWSAKRSKENQ